VSSMSHVQTTTHYTHPAALACLGCAVVSFGQAKDLETIESRWAMSGQRPTQNPGDHTATAA